MRVVPFSSTDTSTAPGSKGTLSAAVEAVGRRVPRAVVQRVMSCQVGHCIFTSRNKTNFTDTIFLSYFFLNKNKL